jgi:transposase
MSDAAQARELKLSRNTVRKWRRVFTIGGIGALKDAPRSGRSRTVNNTEGKAIIAAREAGATYRSIAEKYGVSAATVYRICSEAH